MSRVSRCVRAMARWVAVGAGAAAALGTDGCTTKAVGNDARGRGHASADVAMPLRVRAYSAAMRTAFDVGPSLHLLVDPTYLPRSSGYGAGDSVPVALLSALENAGVVQGRCAPPREGDGKAPSCPARQPGYVVRVSDLFQLGRDSVELYVLSEIYAPAAGVRPQPFSFEMAYQLVRRGESWRVVREGRVRQSGAASTKR